MRCDVYADEKVYTPLRGRRGQEEKEVLGPINNPKSPPNPRNKQLKHLLICSLPATPTPSINLLLEYTSHIATSSAPKLYYTLYII